MSSKNQAAKAQAKKVSTEGLENAPETNLSKHVVTDETPKFTDLEWLRQNNPLDFHSDDKNIVSSKYDKDREIKIQDGLKLLGITKIGDVEINPLLILLGAWWEVKPARSAIKNFIDDEAKAKGYTADVYLQMELGKQVEAFNDFQTAIDRVKYAKTYYKPRTGLSTKILTKPIIIEKVTYLVPIIEFEAAKIKYAGNLPELRKYLISISQVAQNEVEEL